MNPSLEIVPCPYMPDGWILMADMNQWICLNTKEGSIIRINKAPVFYVNYHPKV